MNDILYEKKDRISGLVTRVVAQEQLMEYAIDMAQTIAANGYEMLRFAQHDTIGPLQLMKNRKVHVNLPYYYESEKQMKRKKSTSPINFILGILTLIYVVIAIRQQLQLPPEERTWNGKIARIPYDFRLPTVERIRAAFWNQDTSQVFLPTVFGIGWSINMYPIIHPHEVLELE